MVGLGPQLDEMTLTHASADEGSLFGAEAAPEDSQRIWASAAELALEVVGIHLQAAGFHLDGSAVEFSHGLGDAAVSAGHVGEHLEARRHGRMDAPVTEEPWQADGDSPEPMGRGQVVHGLGRHQGRVRLDKP